MSSATTHDSGHAAHRGHGHGAAHGDHGGPGDQGSTDRASVVLAVLLAAAFVLAAWYLSNWGVRLRNAAPASNPEQHATSGGAAETKVTAAAASSEVGRRTEFAATFEKRQRARGHGLEVRAGGAAHDTLEINWTTEREREHVEQIKQAEPLLREARGLGFTRLLLKVVGREVFSRVL